MENCHLQWIFPLKMVIFHSYVSLPEGKPPVSSGISHYQLGFMTGGFWGTPPAGQCDAPTGAVAHEGDTEWQPRKNAPMA